MSTERTTTSNQSTNSALQFAPAGMSAYNALIPQAQLVLADYMKDPFKASYFNQQLGMSDQYVRNIGERNMQNVLTNAVASGWGSGNMPGFMQNAVLRTGRATGAMQSNNMMNLLLGAEANRRWSAGAGLAFQPLVTGQKTTGTNKTTQSESGLGTWLPQVIGAGLGFAAGGLQPGGGWNWQSAVRSSAGLPSQATPFGWGGYGYNPMMGPFGWGGANPYGFGGGGYFNYDPQQGRSHRNDDLRTSDRETRSI